MASKRPVVKGHSPRDIRKVDPSGGRVSQISPEVVASAAGLPSLYGPTRVQITMPPLVWMGPYQPLKPIAQDPQQGVIGRQLDFPVGYNIRILPRQEEGMTFAQLRGLADGLDILRLVIEKRKDQVESYDWEVMAKDGSGDSSEEQAQIKKCTEFFLQPSTEHDWTTWLRAALEDVFVTDAWTLYPRLTRGGDLYSLDLLDGATITRKIDSTGRTPEPPDVAFQQVLKGIPVVDYTRDQLIYTIRNPRSWKLYGYPPVEQVVLTVNTAIRKTLWQLNYFTEGNIPEAIAGLPESWNLETVQQFQRYWDAILEGNLATRRHMKFVPFDPTKIKDTKEPELFDTFDEWLARIVCFAFSLPPTPFIKQMNRATAEAAAVAAKEEGIVPLLTWLKRRLDYIILKYLKCDLVEFKWALDEEISPEVLAGINTKYVESGIISRDEAREDIGKDKRGMDELTVTTAAGVIPLKEALDKSKKDIAAASASGDPGLAPAPKPEPGAPGAPGGKGKPAAEKVVALR